MYVNLGVFNNFIGCLLESPMKKSKIIFKKKLLQHITNGMKHIPIAKIENINQKENSTKLKIELYIIQPLNLMSI